MNESKVIWGQHPWAGAFGLSELEALACGKPLFASFDPSKHPLAYRPPVFSYDDPAEIATATRDMLNDSQVRRDIGENGVKWVAEFHSLETVSRALLDIYHSVLAPRASSCTQ